MRTHDPMPFGGRGHGRAPADMRRAPFFTNSFSAHLKFHQFPKLAQKTWVVGERYVYRETRETHGPLVCFVKGIDMPIDNTAPHPNLQPSDPSEQERDPQGEFLEASRFERQLELDRDAAFASLQDTRVRLSPDAPSTQAACVRVVPAPTYEVEPKAPTSPRGLRHPLLAVTAAAITGAIVGGAVVGGIFTWQTSGRVSNVGILGVTEPTQGGATTPGGTPGGTTVGTTGGTPAHPVGQDSPNTLPTETVPLEQDTPSTQDERDDRTTWGDVADGVLDEGFDYFEGMTLGDIADLLGDERLLGDDWLDFDYGPHHRY